MSLTYAEIYKNKLRNKENINSDNNDNDSRNPKFITLIKKFPVKQREVIKNEKNVKPRRIQSKSVQVIQKYRKTNSKKKTISKQKFENNEKNKNKKLNKAETNDKTKQKKNKINKNNNFGFNRFYKTDINNNNLVQEKDENKKNNYNTGFTNNTNNKEYLTYEQNNDLLELNEFNKVNVFDAINKKNSNTLDIYFDVFRLRQKAANFKDKIKYSYLSKYNSNNDLNKNSNLNQNNKYNNKHHKIKSYSDFIQKKSKTYYKAIKLKEELEKNINDNNINTNVNNCMRSSCNNFKKKNKKKLENTKKDENKNLVIEMNKHFFDENENRPKVMKKFLTQKEISKDDKKESKNNANFRTRSFRPIINNNDNCKSDENEKNILIRKFCSEKNQEKYKRKINFNNKSLDLIVQDNPKLNNLLRKIPSSKKNKEKAFDLINYILEIKRKNDKINYISNFKYNSNNNINLDIYPVNEWEPISRLKYENLK